MPIKTGTQSSGRSSVHTWECKHGVPWLGLPADGAVVGSRGADVRVGGALTHPVRQLSQPCPLLTEPPF